MLPSPLLLSDLAFLLLTASARWAAANSLCCSLSSFSRWFLAAAPRIFWDSFPFRPADLALVVSATPGDLDLPRGEIEPELEVVRWRLEFCFTLPLLLERQTGEGGHKTHSSLSSLARLPNDPISLLSSIALRSISSSS